MPDGFVLMGPLDMVESAVQVALDQDMPEAIAREPQRPYAPDLQRLHQVMGLIQLATELAYHLMPVGTHHACDQLSCKLLPFDAGDLQQLAQRRVQPPDPLTDHSLDAGGQ